MPAFWDTSALVSLCVLQKATPAVRRLAREHEVVVWWGTPVEMHSAFERLLRMRQVSATGHSVALRQLDKLRKNWREIQPSANLRSEAEVLLAQFPLRAADALQLAAAVAWSAGFPKGRVFIAWDGQLYEAARQLGFQAILV